MVGIERLTRAVLDLRLASLAFVLASLVFFVASPPPSANAFSGSLNCQACETCPPAETPVADEECNHCRFNPPSHSYYCSCCEDEEGNAECCWAFLS